ncbi:juvenile hormone acid O-methyltransferase [Thrips palmi]|uniref:Juvenile hormone acid O-methyltransferase n=1 Tax=Thrips palmi TaxID=161013 RepID=A0A6P8ZQV5_THRPL|nr:juvenile hormone acid O-methyltransferase [Thrips palmi]
MDNAGVYAGANPLQKRDATETVKEFFHKMRWGSRETVLDVGCGPGDVTAKVLFPKLPVDASCVGVDLSDRMVHHASTNHGHPRLSFFQFDISTKDTHHLDRVLQLYPATKVVSFYCLHWVLDQSGAVKNIYRLLAPGGETLLVLLARSPVFELYEKMAVIPEWSEYMRDSDRFISPYQHVVDPRAVFHDLLTAEGLEVLHCSCREQTFDFSSLDSLRESVKAVNPFLDRIPEDLREKFIDECMATAAGLCDVDKERHTVRTRYSLLVAHARKPWQKNGQFSP